MPTQLFIQNVNHCPSWSPFATYFANGCEKAVESAVCEDIATSKGVRTETVVQGRGKAARRAVVNCIYPSQVPAVPALGFLLVPDMGQLLCCANNIPVDVEKCRVALQRCPPGHPRRSTFLSSLAISLHDRFEQQGVLSDLDEAIELYRAVLELCPPGHDDRSTSLDNLAISLQNRFNQRGVLSDLDEVIDLHRAALELHPPGDSFRASSLNNLASSLRVRFEQQGVLSELDEAIELHRAALQLRPPGHSDRSISLNNLAISLRIRFKQRSILSDLDEAIELHRAVLELRPPGHPDRPMSLNNLASSLQNRFELQGILSDLDEAINLLLAALKLRPPGHPDRSMSLNNLATSLQNRFEKQGALSDLDGAIELHRDALELHPPGHSLRTASLDGLATSLRARFELRGIVSDLDEAIELHRGALELYPPGHSDRSMSLNGLASSLHDRFEQTGVQSDLDQSIELHRAALKLRPLGHSDRFLSLNNLAISLLSKFEQCGIQSNLDEAIELHRAALELRPPGHPGRSMSLINLASSLDDRFEQRGVLSDVDEAIELYRAALQLCPPGHYHQSACLNNLATALHGRFEKRGVPSDLDEVIELHRTALELHPPGHSFRPASLNGLAIGLQDRFKQRGVLSDLDEAIELHRAALELRPPGHADQSVSLNNLASSLHTRFKQQGAPSDLDEAIELHRTALELLPPDHSSRTSTLDSLAVSLQGRFQQLGLSPDLDEAFRLHSQISQVSHAVSRSDLDAAKSWATSAEQLHHGSALMAYQTTLRFLDQHVTTLSSSSRHFDTLKEATSSLAMDAFSCGVRNGSFSTAVELVEQGRAVFWTQLARFRKPLDELSASGDTGMALAAEFKQLSFRLRNAFDESTEDMSPQIRQLTMQWDDVVSRIRMIPDFAHFLLPPLFSDLQKAAEDGPVIIVNASEYSCDVLIITSAPDPIHIPLDLTRVEVSELSSEFQFLADDFGSADHELDLISILRKLWDCVVGPVVQALKELIQPGSRIWWCPTAEFTLLPLHAAGPYEKKIRNLSHFYISSYTPTLAALIRARQQLSRDTSMQHFVAIGQANPNKGKALRCVAPELAVVDQRLSPIVSFASLEDSDATVQGALDVLSHNQWLHLACHGMPNRKESFESSFAMRDGPLTIKEIIRSHWQNLEFAFLSACHTTVGDESSPDEAIHLAAAMQFSGFRSVIGSMWSVDDEVARQVVSAFYDNLVDGSGRLDCKQAAIALHKAVKLLRKKIPLEQQIVFVHIGV
ncbi:CHAT domain-containing protein [Suillus ampliporus]|nr:CHAT domain-containing protein [Suillus ampliporus]